MYDVYGGGYNNHLCVCVQVVLFSEQVLLVLGDLLAAGEDGEAGHLPQAARPHVSTQPVHADVSILGRQDIGAGISLNKKG
jgi:hypothetical protein